MLTDCHQEDSIGRRHLINSLEHFQLEELDKTAEALQEDKKKDSGENENDEQLEPLRFVQPVPLEATQLVPLYLHSSMSHHSKMSSRRR